jgi:hypothetical protein
VTGYKPTGHGRNRLLGATLIVSAATLAVVLGLAYSMRWLGGPASEYRLPIALSADTIDFGRVPLNGSVVRQLVVRNDSPQPVRARISVDGASYSVDPQELILHPGVSSRISVAVTAKRPGRMEDELRIQFDDDEALPVVVGLSGEADTPLPPGVGGFEQQRAAAARDSAPAGEGHAGAVPDYDASASTSGSNATPVLVAEATTGPGSGEPGAATLRRAMTTPAAVAGRAARNTGDASAGGETVPDPSPRTRSVQVMPYNPAVPFQGVADVVPVPAGGAPAGNANEIPSRIPGAEENGLPEDVPEDLAGEDSPFDDVFDDDDDPQPSEPELNVPALKISALSTVRLLGAAATFYPQDIPVLGGTIGGALGLGQVVQFPQVPLAFGESMVFAATSAGMGSFDSGSGSVQIQVPVQAVDADGDAAPMTLNLTTGTVSALNESGQLVTISGTPRASANGVLRLVAIEKIPVGYKNGAEEHLAVFEILASLNFGTSPTKSTRSFGRLGG